jgi:hypothetical protein
LFAALFSALERNMVATKKKSVKKTTTAGETTHIVSIPALKQATTTLTLIGDRPLLVNNKLSVAQAIADRYGPGGDPTAKHKPTGPEQYLNSFYTLPDSKHPAPHKKGRYGVPTSGIKKCVCSAIRTTGVTDNTTIGLIGKSFWVLEDCGGLNLIHHNGFEEDIRPVNIGSGGKTVPDMRHRVRFDEWKLIIKVSYNIKVLNPEAIVNLFMHAGQYIGLCENRAEKKQGQCGGFIVEGIA